MITLIVGIAVALYLFVGIIEVLGIYAQYLFEPDEAPTLFESFLIVIGWGVFAVIAWLSRRNIHE